MADLMREIVAEALGRTGRKAGQPAARDAAGQAGHAAGMPGNVSGMPGIAASASGMPGALNRPNWQQAYRDKRLQLAGGYAQAASMQAAVQGAVQGAVQAAAGGHPARSSDAPASGAGERRTFVEQTLSPLLRLMMVQGKTKEEPQSCGFFPDDGGQPVLSCSGMVGRHEGGIRCWFYPDLTPRLAAEFGLHRVQPVSVGVVSSEMGSLRPLFVLDEVLAAGPAHADVTVHREAGGLEIRLIGKERGAIQSVIERLSLALRQQAGNAPRILTAAEPSAMLARALDIPVREAAAVFDGLNRHRSIALLDLAFKAAPELDIRYRIEPSHLLIHGSRDAVLEAVKVMKQEAGPYLTEE